MLPKVGPYSLGNFIAAEGKDLKTLWIENNRGFL